MLTGKELGAALLEAMKAKGVRNIDVAREFKVAPPSVSEWKKFGRLSKHHINHMVEYFSDAVGPEHWGLPKQSQQTGDAEDWSDVRGFAQAVGLGQGREADEYAEIHKLKFKSSSLRGKSLNPDKLTIFYGVGDSMLPRIRPGDAIMFDESDIKVIDDTLYVVMWGQEYYVKRSQILDDRVYFKSDNPQGDSKWIKARRMDNPKDPISVIGRVRWIGSWED